MFSLLCRRSRRASRRDGCRRPAFMPVLGFMAFALMNGIVAPGAEYDAVLARLEEDLHALRDAETGAPVIARTVRTRDAFGDDVHPALPDLVVFWAEHDRPLRRVRHPRAELTQSPHAFHRGSHHTTEGLLVAAGPGVRGHGRVDEVNPLALAPTLLTLLDVVPPAEMTGAPLRDWLADVSVLADTGT